MKEVTGNIWGYYNEENAWIVISTNGTVENGKAYIWDNKASAQAGMIHENISEDLGTHINKNGNIPCIFRDLRIITFPIKNKKEDKPNLELIKLNLGKLIKIINTLKLKEVYMMAPGCNSSKDELSYKKEVKPLVKNLDERFNIIIE